MFITAVKTQLVEALNLGFSALGPNSQSEGIELVPRSVTINYPEESVDWPAILVQFRSTSNVQWTGLDPDNYVPITPNGGPGTPQWTGQRAIYFEGAVDLTVLALASEERDRLWDTLYDLVLMNPLNPASVAFYGALSSSDLIGMTFNPALVEPIGDVINQGTPWDPDEFTYEASVRLLCIGTYLAGETITNGVTAGGPFLEEFYSLEHVTATPYIEPPGYPLDPDDGWINAN